MIYGRWFAGLSLGLWMSFTATASAVLAPDPLDSLRYIDEKIAFRSEIAACFADHDREERDYDAQHYTIHLTPDFDTESLTGEVEMLAVSMIDGLSVITMDMGSRITPTAVSSDGTPLEYEHVEDLLTITLDSVCNNGETFSVMVAYSGKPLKWTFTFAYHESIPVFATMSEPEGGRQWWPSNDVPWDKATTVLSATVPDWMFVASNGLQTGDDDHGDGTHTITWTNSYPIATYLVSAAGTNYETIMFEYTPEGCGCPPMPVPVYVYPELRVKAETAFEDTVDMIGFFALSIGEYPFLNEKYGQVLVPNGGGMEHQTITHINADYLKYGGKPNSLIAHELAHMWWGDYITMSDWPHIWLNESFATYSDALYQEYRYGADHLKNLMRSYANREYQGSIYDPIYLFDSIVYTKGACVLHMLRRIVGTDNFWAILQTYYDDQQFAYGNASTKDFQSICESVYGEDLGWFFQQWIYGQKRPTIRYGWDYSSAGSSHGSSATGSGTTASGYTTTITLEQVQQNLPLFRFPVDVQVQTIAGNVTQTVWMDEALHQVQIESPEPPLMVVLDPDAWLLAWKELSPDQFQFTSPEKLPATMFGSEYSTSIELINGTPPYTMAIISGTLPMGIDLDLETGYFSGFPLEKGTFNFTLHAWDSRLPAMHTIRSFQLKALSPLADIAVIPDREIYAGGDVITVGLSVSNQTEEPLNTTMFIALEIVGEFYFLDVTQGVFPSFSEQACAIPLPMAADFSIDVDLLAIPLPDPMPALSGTWWGLLLDDASGTAAGPISMVTFWVE